MTGSFQTKLEGVVCSGDPIMSEVELAFRRGDFARIEQQGFEAGLRHLSTSDNPYLEMTWQYEVWEQGRQSAQRMEVHRYGTYH